jgi:hypothetical protein
MSEPEALIEVEALFDLPRSPHKRLMGARTG